MASVTGKLGTRASRSFSRASRANESDVSRINRARSSRKFCISFRLNKERSFVLGQKNFLPRIQLLFRWLLPI
jgi:hypothetical protein